MTIPIGVYAEMTPNPVTMKFVLNLLLIEEKGKALSFAQKKRQRFLLLQKKYLNFLSSTEFLLLPILLLLLRMKAANGTKLFPKLKS
jgi:hypothetical protein